MTDLNKERKAFEGKFPKPHWIEWDEELGQYTSKHVSDVGYQARFEVWLEAKAQAVPDTHIVVPRNREVVVAIEKMVEQQVEASGITSDVFRLDGWRILDAIQEASESGAEG
ncbi:hypothetical protein [Acinetobacter baumannii]|uniref:hypothetical protein n=1 Tax=Acinetobacter baumannii TaxID=470 RepID=UPI003B42B5E8